MKRYLIDFLIGMAVYALLLVISLRLLGRGVENPALCVAVSLLPMLGGLLVCRAVIRQLRRMDELQRKIQFDAFALAFTGTALATFGYGFLENVGAPKLSMFAVWPLMAALWVLGLIVARRRDA
ncbi:MAG: hypothetical protein QM682_15400 [Paracoccus sp. (in: a-proteobacteria)]|uniref:hypothetical protein n=1 Tax=Paracoccus sp. TaxID=267 RepID=UPI0039E57978